MKKIPVWLHITGMASFLTTIGGFAAAILDPSGEAVALFPAGVFGLAATSQIATNLLD